jgi:hypothetical protein
MLSDSHDQRDATIDRAAAALRGLDVPEGPPADVLDRVRAAGVGVALLDRKPARRGLLAGLAVAAAVLLAAGLFTLPKFGGGGGTSGASNFAFADVVRELGKVRTVTYREHAKQEGEDEYESVSRETVAMDGKFSRSETLDEAGKIVQVAVYNAGRMLNYNFTDKTASLYDYTGDDGVPHSLDDRHTLADLLKLDPAKAKPLGEKEFDGKKLIGFSVNRDYDTRNLRSVNVWVDPKTKLPARVEHTIAYRYPSEAQTAEIFARKEAAKREPTAEETEKQMDAWPWVKQFVVITDIVFDVPVDESTFSLDPPKGYELNVTRVAQ